MRVGLATCDLMPELWMDDVPLRDALVALGCVVDAVPWQRLDGSLYDAVVVRSAWDYPRYRSEFLAWARSVPGWSTRTTSSSRTRTRATCCRCRCRPYQRFGCPARLVVRPGRCAWPRAVVKPAVSAGLWDTVAFRRRWPRLAQELRDGCCRRATCWCSRT